MTEAALSTAEIAAPTTAPAHIARGDLAVPSIHGWWWGLFARAAFIYCFPEAIGLLRLGKVTGYITRPWELLRPYFNQLVGGKPSGPAFSDPRYSTFYFLYGVLFACLVGLLWRLIDRGGKRDALIHEAARLCARYQLAAMLFYYGGEKFLGDQGGWALEPSFMLDASGTISGFAAMMSWLSYSTLYAWFAGWAEAGAGLLMFSRRFTTLAALLCLADMGMVWLINQSYWDHWGGAAFSPIHFMPAALILLAPHVARFANFFVLNRPTAMTFDRVHIPLWFRYPATALKVVMVPWIIYSQVGSSYWHGKAVHTYSPLTGAYRVEQFERNGVIEPVANEFPDRWFELAFSSLGSTVGVMADIYVRTVDDRKLSFSVVWPNLREQWNEDPMLRLRFERAVKREKMTEPPEGDLPLGSFSSKRLGEAAKYEKPRDFGTLHYIRQDPDQVTLEGTVNGEKLKMRLRRIARDTLPYFRFRWKPI